MSIFAGFSPSSGRSLSRSSRWKKAWKTGKSRWNYWNWLLNAEKAFTVIKQQPARQFGAGLVSIQQTIRQRGVHALKVNMQDDSGHPRHQYFVFLVGVPVNKILAVLAGLALLVLGFIWNRKRAVKRDRAV